MDLSKLSLEEALRLGVITRGSWNDDDYVTYDFDREEYNKVFEFARQKHTECNSVFTTELRTGASVPYMTVIENTLSILSKELDIHNYTVLKTAALYNITVKTDCKLSDLGKIIDNTVCKNVNVLAVHESESLEDYINRCIKSYEDSDAAYMPVCILLAAELTKQRLIKYPFESWKEDSPYYLSQIKQLEPFIEVFKEKNWGKAVRLTEKLIEQLEDNRTRSLNMNKTAEELFGSSSDDDGEW